jgi:hypothetical protein
MHQLQKRRQNCTAKSNQTPAPGLPEGKGKQSNKMVRLVGLEPTTGKTPADFKPAAYANFATAAPAVYAAQSEYHAAVGQS